MKQQFANAMRSRGGAVVLALLWIAAMAAGLGLNGVTHYQAAFASDDERQEAVNNSPFALILGEIRSSAADLMWIKTERYLHRGVAYAPHVDEDAMAHSGEAVAIVALNKPPAGIHDEEHEHHGKGPEALVPEASKDYRGLIGTLQREVQPWLPPGAPDEHTGSDELLPWYRMLTYANPHHWRGYVIGTWWLMQQTKENPKALDEAGKFIDEGIRNNPEAFQLRLMRGRLLLQREQWRPAIADFRKAVAQGVKIRPADGKPKEPIWTDPDEEDFRAAARYIPFVTMRKLGDKGAAKAEIERLTLLIPHDLPLIHMRDELALK